MSKAEEDFGGIGCAGIIFVILFILFFLIPTMLERRKPLYNPQYIEKLERDHEEWSGRVQRSIEKERMKNRK